MNTLSMFLYLADVIGKFQGLLIALSIVTFAIWGVRVAVTAICNDHNGNLWSQDKTIHPYPSIFKSLVLPIFFAFLAAAIPSRDTMYLIAGSEVAEVVVTTPEAREVFDETKEAILRIVRGIGENK